MVVAQAVRIKEMCVGCGSPYPHERLSDPIIVCEACNRAYIPDSSRINFANLAETQQYVLNLPDLGGQDKIRKSTPKIKEAVTSLYNLVQNDLTVTIGESKFEKVQAFENIQLKREDDLIRIVANHFFEPYYPETSTFFSPQFIKLFVITAGEFETEDSKKLREELRRKKEKVLFSWFSKEEEIPEPQKEFRIYAEIGKPSAWTNDGIPRHVSDFEIPDTSLENFMERLAQAYPSKPHTVTEIQRFLGYVQGLESVLSKNK